MSVNLMMAYEVLFSSESCPCQGAGYVYLSYNICDL